MGAMESMATTLAEVTAAHAAAGQLWHEFLRVEALSAGLYVLEPGASDPQLPHREDELYVVVQGRGALRVGELDYLVQAGSIVFVAAQAAHHFHSIVERLEVLVFFAPAESAPTPAAAAGSEIFRAPKAAEAEEAA